MKIVKCIFAVAAGRFSGAGSLPSDNSIEAPLQLSLPSFLHSATRGILCFL